MGGLLITTGAAWLLVERLDVPGRVGLHRSGVTPSGVQVVLAALVLAAVASTIASPTVAAPRVVRLLVGGVVALRALVRTLALVDHPDDLEATAPIALLSSTVTGLSLAAVCSAAALALRAPTTLDRTAWLVLAALTGIAISGLGAPSVIDAGADAVVSIGFVVAGLAFWRRAGPDRRRTGPD